MRFYLKFLIGIVIISFLFTINYITPLYITNKEILTLIEVASIVVGGLYFLFIITDGLRSVLEGKGSFSVIIPNIVKYLGYIIIFISVFSALGVTSGEAIVGGAFAGIVIGLALQPILQNFFAGLLIMGTGFISTGDHVRIMSTEITYTPALLPPYKFFSRDFIEQGIEGDVVEIDLFFSRILMDNGREIRVPNFILLESSVIEYSSKLSKEFIVNVRVEFPLNKLDLERVEEQITETLRGFEIVEGPYLYEQSDKDHVVISLKVKSDVENWKKVKSEVLRRLLILRKRIVES
jgi:small-conductance mechanosensitive channel